MYGPLVPIRLYAYAVEAQKGVDNAVAPPGGALALVGTLGPVVEQATQQAPHRNWLEVRLNVNAGDAKRSHPIRDPALALAFGTKRQANAAAERLAFRLSGFMDQRMKGCLLAIAVDQLDGGRQVTLWTFPRDEALQFMAGRGGG